MKLQGSHVAIVTPFLNGKLDEAAFEKLIEFQIANGTDGIVPCGTTGESATMDHSEHVEVVKACIRAVRGRVRVTAGTGSNSTREAIELTREAKEAGADAALLITPYYNKPTQRGLYEHYKAVAEAVNIPLIVYNCPGRTGVSINPETLFKLAQIPGIAGVKDATANPDWTTEVAKGCKLTILSGDDARTLPLMALGAAGVISVTANILPRKVSEQCRLTLEGRWAEAKAIHEELYDLTKALFVESNPIPVKAACAMMGRAGPELRLPLTPLGEENAAMLRNEMRKAGIAV